MNVAELEREGHARIAEGHAMLAKAAEMRARAPSATTAGEWVPAHASPLGRRRTLELAREGKLESKKVGRNVLVSARSLRTFIEKHPPSRTKKAVARAKAHENLFG